MRRVRWASRGWGRMYGHRGSCRRDSSFAGRTPTLGHHASSSGFQMRRVPLPRAALRFAEVYWRHLLGYAVAHSHCPLAIRAG